MRKEDLETLILTGQIEGTWDRKTTNNLPREQMAEQGLGTITKRQNLLRTIKRQVIEDRQHCKGTQQKKKNSIQDIKNEIKQKRKTLKLFDTNIKKK